MRRGSISLGDVQCNKCHRMIPAYERYLIVDEEKGAEADKGKPTYYCVQCALKKGYASDPRREGREDPHLLRRTEVGQAIPSVL